MSEDLAGSTAPPKSCLLGHTIHDRRVKRQRIEEEEPPHSSGKKNDNVCSTRHTLLVATNKEKGEQALFGGVLGVASKYLPQ